MASHNDLVPRTYEQWRHCITVDCGMALTPAYIEQRLHALRDDNDDATRRFIAVYGPAHHRAVIGWFERAGAELNAADSPRG
ncbi:hypothetical protein C84B14_09217 [Salinisphaera sp. C84B14]|uniref:hypothetical protein n=1 Tax=Salinisphaera sp. C84B14 TaxID=1304155 RepID=UPI00334053CA